jgi:cell division protease FtsH
MNMKRYRGPIIGVIVLVLIAFLVEHVAGSTATYKNVNLSVIEQEIGAHSVAQVTLNDKEQQVQVTLKSSGTKQQADYPDQYGQTIVAEVQKANDGLATADKTSYKTDITKSNVFVALLEEFFPLIIIVGLLLLFMNQMQGGGNRVMSFGKSKARLVSKDTPKTSFTDVAGADEAIEELQEIKEFLENPAKFQAIGAKIPKGVLLYGPPGTGKTLLARAVAGEAGVPFYSISGSDFVEMFVGVGASRVRDLFEQAKTNAPAIIFVDEIDAVGRHRGAGLGGGHDEREQTLNQLLVEMDGFDVKGGVILIAATNRPDILDPALLRPGRFDRQIPVGPPDLAGRKAVLEVHAKGKPIAPDVDLMVIARRTPGMTGADLANVINEAALLTARQGQQLITAVTLEESIDRVMAGPQRKTRVMSDKERKVTAYHEGGHALVAHALPNMDPVHKLTILPRGRALGYTMVLPEEDRYSQTRAELEDSLAYALGGRAAEELVFHDVTTGAANDIERATATARAMVTQYGMSPRLGALKFGQESGEVFLGRDMGHQRDYSEEIAGIIDEEIRSLIEKAHDEAYAILDRHRDVLDDLVLRLLDKETLDRQEIAEIFTAVKKEPHRPIDNGTHEPSKIPPVRTAAELALLGPDDVVDLLKEPKVSGSEQPASRPAPASRPRRTPSRSRTPSPSANRTANPTGTRGKGDAAKATRNEADGTSPKVRRKPSTEPGS